MQVGFVGSLGQHVTHGNAVVHGLQHEAGHHGDGLHVTAVVVLVGYVEQALVLKLEVRLVAAQLFLFKLAVLLAGMRQRIA